MLSRQTLLYYLLAILLSFGLYLFFGIFFEQQIPPYASTIASAFLGSIITVIITMILLNRQSEAEMAKERNVKLLETKIETYNDLIERVKNIMIKGSVSSNDVAEIQILNHRLSFVAAQKVLELFNDFANTFIRASRDEILSEEEKDELLDNLADMSVEIRYDLASEEEKRSFNSEKIKSIIQKNVRSLAHGKTTPKEYLSKCSDAERNYFGALFDYMDKNNIQYNMGITGFAVKDRHGKSIAQFWPSSVRRYKILMQNIDSARRDSLPSYFIELNQNAFGADKSTLLFTYQNIPIERLCNLISELVLG